MVTVICDVCDDRVKVKDKDFTSCLICDKVLCITCQIKHENVNYTDRSRTCVFCKSCYADKKSCVKCGRDTCPSKKCQLTDETCVDCNQIFCSRCYEETACKIVICVDCIKIRKPPTCRYCVMYLCCRKKCPICTSKVTENSRGYCPHLDECFMSRYLESWCDNASCED
jgi:hypothetical protein